MPSPDPVVQATITGCNFIFLYPFGGADVATPGGSNLDVQFNDSGDFGGADSFLYDKATQILRLEPKDGATNSSTVALGFFHASTGAPTIGFGVTQNFSLDTTEHSQQLAGSIIVSWNNAANASYASTLVLYVADWQGGDSGTGGLREGLRIQSDGTYAYVGIGGAVATTASLLVQPPVNTKVGAIVRGLASQSGDLQQWQDSTPTTVASINKGGTLTLPTTGFGFGTGKNGAALVMSVGNRVQFAGQSTSADSSLIAFVSGFQYSGSFKWVEIGCITSGSSFPTSGVTISFSAGDPGDAGAVGKTPFTFNENGVIGATGLTASKYANVGGAIYDHFADVATTHTDGTEDDLYTDTTVASQLGANGDKIEARYVVNTVAHATATRKIKVYFAGTAIYDSTAQATAVADTLDLSVLIIRESSTVVRCIVSEVQSGTIGFANGKYTRLTGLTLSGTNIIKVTGAAAATGAAASDITAVIGEVKWIPAAT